MGHAPSKPPERRTDSRVASLQAAKAEFEALATGEGVGEAGRGAVSGLSCSLAGHRQLGHTPRGLQPIEQPDADSKADGPSIGLGSPAQT